MKLADTHTDTWDRADLSIRRTRLPTTVKAQLMQIAAGVPCSWCKGVYGDARVVRRGLRWCLYCARMDGIQQRQALETRDAQEE